MGIQTIIFLLVLTLTAYFAYTLYGRVFRNIRLGKSNEGETNAVISEWPTRLKNMLLVAFGQKKMFKRLTPAVLHLAIYTAFLITQIEFIEIIADGISGNHRLFANPLGGFYTFVISFIEILSVFAFIATFVFLYRRNIIKLARFEKPEMQGWPKLDANLILLGELLLIIGIFSMNGADTLLQKIDPAHYPDTGNLAVSAWLGPVLFGGLSEATLQVVERFGWWLHLLVVFGFILYLPMSKHLHIFLAFPNTFFADLRPRGEMSEMPAITKEIKSMLGMTEDAEEMSEEIPEFGSKDVTDLRWQVILGAYTCTECGRCTSVCPANTSGKKLSPRKIMMDIRDRAEEVGEKIATGSEEYLSEEAKEKKLSKETFSDGSTLFDRISDEELFACTTCNACVEACPVMINPLEPILELRRYKILTEAAGPQDWNPLFTSMENSGSVWQLPDERVSWSREN